MRRLFSTFATGLPGVGLLLMRLVVGVALIYRGVTRMEGDPSQLLIVLSLLLIASGLLLLIGLWTPIAGTVAVAVEVVKLCLLRDDTWVYVLLGTLSAALVLLGPGRWSIDARLFGWKRIDVRGSSAAQKSRPDTR